MLEPDVRVTIQSSTIHGKGLFANEKIKAGELIFRFNKSKRAIFDRGPDHQYWKDNFQYFGYHFINHSETPSAKFELDTHIKFFALHDIVEGEEITVQYPRTWW
jgi:SET domain-containing protein